MDFIISIKDQDKEKEKLIHLLERNFTSVEFVNGKYSVSHFRQVHKGSKAYISDKSISEVFQFYQKHGSGQTAEWLGLGIRTFQRAVASYRKNNLWTLSEKSKTTLFRTGTAKNIYARESENDQLRFFHSLSVWCQPSLFPSSISHFPSILV